MIILGIDPDADRHGVAVYIDGKLCELLMMNTPELIIDFIPSLQESHNILLSIENVCANKGVYERNKNPKKSVESAISNKVGRVQQAQVELMRWLDRYCIRYVLHKPQSGNWADKKELFQKVTGWTKQSNADTRAAAFFGYLALSPAEIKAQQQREHLQQLREGTANILENSGFAKAIHLNRDKVKIEFGK